MIPTKMPETTEPWVCRSCSSMNAGWRLRCERCGVLVARPSLAGQPPQMPPPSPAPRRRTSNRVLRVLACIGVLNVGAGVAVFGVQAFRAATEGHSAEERVDEYVNGIGEKEFFAADSQFRATYPVLPQRSTKVAEVNGIPIEFTLYTSDLGTKAFSVSTYEPPPDTPFDLTLGVNGAAAAVDGRVESATFTTWQGFEAVEAVISEPSHGAFIKALVIVTPQRVYHLQVVSLNDPTDEYEKFKASFYIAL